jgi:predicted Ser/Thr protein kinase
MVGKTISHYQVLEKIGEGGMGVVYKARDTRLSRLVALKVLPPGKIGDTECKRRFVQEAQAASALNHPNIVHIYDIDQQDGVEYIAMEYVAGKTLDQLIPRHGMRLNEALKHSVEIADALTKAHSAGIIHRDLKPSNVMVNAEGRVKVLDFGLAKLTEAAPLEEDEATLPAKPRTKEGTIVGTVSYMSPEQAEGKKVDARSDIFSFGSVLYEMVTGRHAFRGDTQVSTLAAIIHKEPESLGSEVPAELSRIITRCLRKDPERRFQLMKDLKIELAEFKEESDSGKLVAVEVPSRSRKRRFLWPAVAAAAAIVLTAAGFFVWQRMQDKPLTERDWIVLADFTNATGDPVFDVALKQALSASLNQSPYLNVLPDERVAGILTLMGRSPDERVTGRVAREVCERAGVKALLTGSINALGSHYSIGLDATNCRTGDRLAQEQLEAASKEQVLGMLGQAEQCRPRRSGQDR